MAQFLFVQDLPADGLQNQRMRSHSAFVSHRRRRLKRDQNEVEIAEKFHRRHPGIGKAKRVQNLRASIPITHFSLEYRQRDISDNDNGSQRV
jgi:hypothetical protein